MKRYNINEIFYSLQGEGSWVGTPMVFVRFAGCNLSCPWCDTEHDEVTNKLTAEEVAYAIDDVSRFDPEFSLVCPPAVCFTGGEPTLQLDTDLIELIHKHHSLHIETNGTRPIPSIRKFRCVTVSPKDKIHSSVVGYWKNTLVQCVLHSLGELKVIWNEEHQDETMTLIEQWGSIRTAHRFLQPLDRHVIRDYQDVLPSPALMKYLREHPNWRLSLQQQKILDIS